VHDNRGTISLLKLYHFYEHTLISKLPFLPSLLPRLLLFPFLLPSLIRTGLLREKNLPGAANPMSNPMAMMDMMKGMMRQCAVLCCAVLYFTLLYSTVLKCTVLYYTVLHYIIKLCTALCYCIVQYYTVLVLYCNTFLHCTATLFYGSKHRITLCLYVFLFVRLSDTNFPCFWE
jgi:hypothetical protein